MSTFLAINAMLFDGKLIHGGAPVLKPRTRRHGLACHYIPYRSENWERDWLRIHLMVHGESITTKSG